MKKLLSFLFLIVLIISCQKDSNLELPDNLSAEKAPPPSTVTICHATNSESNPWITLQINENALPAHLAHGDINPDSDGDGFTAINPCGIGDQTDCDDNEFTTNPGAEEICDDEVDNNCDGSTDCDDPNCIGSDLCFSCCFEDVLDEFQGELAFQILFTDIPGATILWPEVPQYGILAWGPPFKETYQCGFSLPDTGQVFFDITEEEYEICRLRILQIAEEAGVEADLNESESRSSGENIFGFN